MPMNDLYRICVKLYASAASPRDETLVPVFHDWIRRRALDVTLIDVADYAHVPESPGVMLIAHEASFSLDRADGRYGLLVQRRRPTPEGIDDVLQRTLRQALDVADKLEQEPRLKGKLSFDRSHVRVESNDRLLAPNDAASYATLATHVTSAAAAVFPASTVAVARVANDARDRLALEVRVS